MKIKFSKKEVIIFMQIKGGLINTKDMPHTSAYLTKNLPGVLKTKCFNKDRLPFSIELKKTEVGHLFEHILIEYLCDERIADGFISADYSGVTSWDWNKSPYGSFKIKLNVPQKEQGVFIPAFQKSINFLDNLKLNNKYFQRSSGKFNFV